MPDSAIFRDDGATLDLGSIDYVLRAAEVLFLDFEFTSDCLIVDMRGDPEGHTPPIVELIEAISNIDEQHLWLDERRPGLPPPRRMQSMTWPHSVASLAESVLLGRVVVRIRRELGADVREMVADALHDLRRREHQDTMAAVRGGEGFNTLWSRKA